MRKLIVLWLLILTPSIQALELSDEPLFTFGRGVITHLDYSPDSKYLAVASTYSIEILETENYTLVSSWDANSYEVVFSPDGKYIASRSKTDLEIFEVSTGKKTRLTSNPSPCMAFRSDGRLMAWFNSGSELQIWNIDERKLENRKTYDMGGSYFKYSPNKEYVACVFGGNSYPKILHLPTGKIQAISVELPNASGGPFVLANEYIICTAQESPVTLMKYNLSSGEKEYISIDVEYTDYDSIALSTDGQYLAVSDQNQTNITIFLKNMKTGRNMILKGPGEDRLPLWCSHLAFSPDMKYLALSLGKRLLYWNVSQLGGFVTTMAKEVKITEGHLTPIYALNFSKDGQLLSAGGIVGSLFIWNTRTGIMSYSDMHAVIYCQSVQFLTGNEMIAIGCDTYVIFEDLEKKTDDYQQLLSPGTCLSISLSPDSKTLAVAVIAVGVTGINGVYLWDAQTHKFIDKLVHIDTTTAVAFQSDGKLLAAGDGATIKIWEWQKKQVVKELSGHKNTIRQISFSNDSSRILSSGDDGLAILWDTKTWSEIYRTSFNGNKAVISPQGNLIAMGCYDGKVILNEGGWNIDTKWSHRDKVNAIEFSPDGSMLATGSEDGTVKLWAITPQNPPKYELPAADFSASSTSGTAPLTVSFTDLSKNNPTSWSWDFGDGETSNLHSPTHVYKNAGDYTVSLKVTNPAGSDTKTLKSYIHVSAQPITPIISIINPTANQILLAGTASTTLTVNIINHTGAWCWKLNEAFPTSGASGGNKVSSGNTATITGLKDGETYTVYAALVDTNGNLLNPSVTSSVKFSIAKPSQTPFFTISALKTTVIASDGYATYLITLEGKNSFNGGVTLYESELPENVKATFNPKKIILSPAELITTAQITLTVGKEVTPGEHPFTILAKPDSGETKELKLTLKVESIALTLTSITLNLQPMEVPFMGSLLALGQLVSVSDKSAGIGDAKVQLTFTSPAGKAQVFEVITGLDGSYRLSKPFSPDEVGKWNVKARFDGNTPFKASERESSFNVTKGRGIITFNTGNTGALGTETMILCSLEPQLKGELISLKVVDPNGKAKIIPGITTEASGIFRYTLPLDTAGDWEVSVAWTGNKNYEAVTQTLRISVSNELGKMILVLGGSYKANDPDWQISSKMMDYVHNILVRQRGFDEEDIYYLSPDPKTAGSDNVTSITALEFAITQWAVKLVNPKVPLYIYMLSHNVEDQFLLDKRGDQNTYLTPALLDSWLDILPEGTQATIIIEACHSGNFIRMNDGQPTSLVGMSRTVIASARGDKRAMILNNLCSFSKLFFDRISANKTINEAFHDTEDQMSRLPILKDQHPEMDADGDGKVNQPQDYAVLSKVYLPANFISKASPPDIIDLTPSQVLSKGVASLRVYAKVLGVSIIGVTATVIPPNVDTSQDITWSSLKLPEFDMAKVPGKDNEYASTYSDFTIPGEYTVIINAENTDGSAIPVQTTITVPGGVVKGDVSGDGKVQSNDAILVLRIVAGIITPTDTQKQSADVNGDGKVGVNDAILILRRAAGLAAPPSFAGTQHDVKDIKLTINEANGIAGELVTASLKVDNPNILASGDICITYDSSVLRAVRVSYPKDILSASNIAVPGVINLAFAAVDGLNSDKLAEVQFEVIADGMTSLSFKNVNLYSFDALLLKSNHVNGRFLSPKLMPKQSALMQNYPNPFNPETWIPYQLRIGSEVKIEIRSLNGELVRELNLGYKPAGEYVSQDRSAYWDGRNEIGELLTSGVYFCIIKAGDLVDVKKMTNMR